jgi:hypothetical protein
MPGCRIFARDLPQHCKKAADLPTSDSFAVEHGCYRIDDDQDRPVCTDPDLDLPKKRSFRDFA